MEENQVIRRLNGIYDLQMVISASILPRVGLVKYQATAAIAATQSMD